MTPRRRAVLGSMAALFILAVLTWAAIRDATYAEHFATCPDAAACMNPPP